MERAVFVPDTDRLPLPGEAYDRLYLGSEFCVWRLPGKRELRDALAVVAGRGIAFSLVTPFLDEPGLERTLDLVRTLPDEQTTEVIANDLGLIEALRAAGWRGTVVAGRLLTRQRRGPGFQSFGEVLPEAAAALRGSALDSPAFVELLAAEYRVMRFELDDLVQGVTVPALPAGVSLSIYRPYLLVTATRNCPWIFDGRTWDRSHGCPRPCNSQALRLTPVQTAGSCRCGPSSTGGFRAGVNPAPTTNVASVGEGFTPARVKDEYVLATDAGRRLLLGGCAQFLEHRNEAPPPAGVDRIVWQPGLPA